MYATLSSWTMVLQFAVIIYTEAIVGREIVRVAKHSVSI